MNENEVKVAALELAIFYLQNQNVTADLAHLTPDEIERVQRAYIELVDSIEYSKGLWEHNTLR